MMRANNRKMEKDLKKGAPARHRYRYRRVRGLVFCDSGRQNRNKCMSGRMIPVWTVYVSSSSDKSLAWILQLNIVSPTSALVEKEIGKGDMERRDRCLYVVGTDEKRCKRSNNLFASR